MTVTLQPEVSTARLDGKIALVTGSGRGIGREIAIELGRRGASVVINYAKSSTAANEVVKQIEASGTRAIAVKADISNPAEIGKLFDKAQSHFGKLDIVVSNSGIEHFASIEDVTPEEFDQVFNLNTRGQFFVAQRAYTHLKQGGRLILMSSISANVGLRQHAVYAGSKCAVEAFGRCLTKEFGSKKITVNVIAPGGVETDMAAEAGWRYIPGADPSWTPEDINKFVSARTPLQRMATPIDIARVVGFLTSEDGGWMNGECNRVDTDGLEWKLTNVITQVKRSLSLEARRHDCRLLQEPPAIGRLTFGEAIH
jgi:NAD(P)-dependent dehydrogenase (short-subunit alcohol dehydrogenase family)